MVLLLGLALSAATTAQSPAAGTPPPIVVGPAAAPEPQLLRLRADEARCGGTVERPVLMEQPSAELITWAPPAPSPDMRLRLSFRIDENGRPLSITDPSGGNAWLAGQGRDLVPAFAVWRFAPGAARAGCEISFTAELMPVAAAPLAELNRLLLLGQPSGPSHRAAWDRTQVPGSTCRSPGPNVRQQVYPAFETIPQAPGTSSYSRIGFDIDARGRPANVRVTDSSGNAALDRQSVDAIRRSRYAPGARRGCTYSYWRRPTVIIAAPLMPSEESPAPAGARCPARPHAFARGPNPTFPPELNRRFIEGWAVLSYDVAPWGELGNIQVLAAEPVARFGTHGANILRGARWHPGAGATGCTFRFRFRLPAEGETPPAASRD